MKIGYISLEIGDLYKQILSESVDNAVERKAFCRLRYKGGNVTGKAHLTLFFGLDYEQLNREALQRDLMRAQNSIKELTPAGFEIFHLRNSRCNAWVMNIDATPGIVEFHRYFKSQYPVMEQYVHEEFKPHVTLAYIHKQMKMPRMSLPGKLEVSEVKLKIYTVSG